MPLLHSGSINLLFSSHSWSTKTLKSSSIPGQISATDSIACNMSDLSSMPLGVNPNGNPPNFAHGTTLQPAVLATGIILMTISLVFTLIRILTSLYNSRKLFSDNCKSPGCISHDVKSWHPVNTQLASLPNC